MAGINKVILWETLDLILKWKQLDQGQQVAQFNIATSEKLDG